MPERFRRDWPGGIQKLFQACGTRSSPLAKRLRMFHGPCFRNLFRISPVLFFPRSERDSHLFITILSARKIAASGDAPGRSMWTAAILAIAGKPHDLRNASAAEW